VIGTSLAPLRLASAIALGLGMAACFSACGGGDKLYSLSSPPGLESRLESILARAPLPAGWRRAEKNERAQASIRLEARTLAEEAPIHAVTCGSLYLAAAVGIADARYSVSTDEARAVGLEALEGIVAPRRALMVDRAWPGSKGYPFAYALYLSCTGAAVARELDAWLAKTAAAEEDRSGRGLREPALLAAAGDMQVGSPQYPELLGGKAGLEALFGPSVLATLREADLSVANLEAPVSDRGEPNPTKRYAFKMPPGSSAALREAGLGLLLFANNHGFDYGPEAFLDSLADLEQGNLPFVGAGKDIDTATAARKLQLRGSPVAFLGFAFYPKERMGFSIADAAGAPGRPGIAADEARTLEAIREARATGSFVVVLAHGGSEYVERPDAAARALYARFVDAGADLVLGSHPHLLQGLQARSGSLIAYSLGNFVFTAEDEPKPAWRSGILEFLVYRGKVRGFRVFPLIAGYERTMADPDQARAEARLTRLCAELEMK
jgi:poly-gamma-glutamate capsule biosynthesis protein CapA/YwtB (metallophosphatase superfamily)